MARGQNEDKENEANIWPASERQAWTLTLFVGVLLVFMSRTAGPVTMVALAKEFQWGKERQGSVLSSYFWGSGMTQLLGGWTSDIYGGDNVLFLTCTAWIIIVFCTPIIIRNSYHVFLSSSTAYLLLRFLMGMCQGAFFGAMSSLLGKKLQTKQKSSTNGIINSGACIGSVIVGVVGSLLLNYVDWSIVFYYIGAIGFVWLVLWKFLLLGSNNSEHIHPNDINELTTSTKKPVSVPWTALLSHSPLWAMVFASVSISICFNLLSTWLPVYFHDTFPQSKGWIFNVIPWLINSPCAFISGIWADNLLHRGYSITCVRKFFNVLAQLGAAVSLLLLSHAQTFPIALILMTFAIGMTGFHNAGAMVTPQDIAPEYAGSVVGVTNTIAAFTVFSAVYFTGYFLNVFQSWPLYFNIVAGICICGCTVFTCFGSAKRITQKTPGH